ncbi:hypothetical protein Lesp01_35330 [Lentzea sp. NBRC 102530]|nr:hypothetical protein Lesp01_35330 [Lentzea sp. NBRC 102530]
MLRWIRAPRNWSLWAYSEAIEAVSLSHHARARFGSGLRRAGRGRCGAASSPWPYIRPIVPETARKRQRTRRRASPVHQRSPPDVVRRRSPTGRRPVRQRRARLAHGLAQLSSERPQWLGDQEIARLLRKAECRATGPLIEHREALDRLAALLTERETLDGAAVGR